MTQAVLEGVAYAFGDCQKVLLEAGAEIGQVSLIGGGSRSRLWGQILASVLNRPLNRHEGSELGPAQGAARLSCLQQDRDLWNKSLPAQKSVKSLNPSHHWSCIIRKNRSNTEKFIDPWKNSFSRFVQRWIAF